MPEYPPRECDRCGREFLPWRYDARYCNECGDNEWHPRVGRDENDPDE